MTLLLEAGLQSRIVQFRLNRYWVSRRSISSVRRPPDRARKRAISRSVCLCRDSTIARTIRLSKPGLWSPLPLEAGLPAKCVKKWVSPPSPEPRLIHREAYATDAARLALPNFLMLVSRWPRARNMILTLHAIADEAIE